MFKLAICDDEARSRIQLKKIFDWQAAGFDVTASFPNGAEVLKYLSNHSLDAVIADVKMPVMDGLELIENLKKHYPQIKAVLISAYRDFEYAKKAIEYDVCYYITKPIKQSDLSAAAKKLYAALSVGENSALPALKYQELSSNTPDFINKILEYIDQHYTEDISLDDIAFNMHMHPGYVSSLLKKYTNATYMDHLTKARIEKAKYLLAETDEKVTVIGRNVGYNYSQYFHKIFKSVTGITPIEYRKNNRKG